MAFLLRKLINCAETFQMCANKNILINAGYIPHFSNFI